MASRRKILLTGAGALAGLPLLVARNAAAAEINVSPGRRVPVVTPNGASLTYEMDGGVKVFRLTAEPVKREFAPGMVVNCWGYNGMTPGPTIEAVEGDRVRIIVTNKLPEPTSVHWHGVRLPFGMDGVGGLTQRHIQPGETYAYEFTLRQHGTQMYHPHSDEMTQMALGMMGFFIIHPREPEPDAPERDFAIFLNEWFIEPGASTPNPAVMLDFNTFTFNSRAYPGTAPLVARAGQRVRLRFANLSMDSHPIHLHGHSFQLTGTDGGQKPPSARFPETTIEVPPGTTRTVEFIADAPGDWPLHCHKSHHAMNAMSHDAANMLGADQSDVEPEIKKLLPEYMAMGKTGMGGSMMGMEGPANTLPMMAGDGPFGPIQMGGMFTVLKVREGIESYDDPGWDKQPAGTSARRVGGGAETKPPEKKGGSAQYTCPMHPQVIQDKPGECPICHMALVEKRG